MCPVCLISPLIWIILRNPRTCVVLYLCFTFQIYLFIFVQMIPRSSHNLIVIHQYELSGVLLNNPFDIMFDRVSQNSQENGFLIWMNMLIVEYVDIYDQEIPGLIMAPFYFQLYTRCPFTSTQQGAGTLLCIIMY